MSLWRTSCCPATSVRVGLLARLTYHLGGPRVPTTEHINLLMTNKYIGDHTEEYEFLDNYLYAKK